MEQPEPALAQTASARPRVLFVYYSYTQQTRKVVEAMAEVLRGRNCEVVQAPIEFTDARYAKRFTVFPLRHVYRDLFGMIPAQIRGATGEIRIPDVAREGDYDLVCIGSPTWWMKTSMPIRSFLKSDAAGSVLNGKRFTAFVVCRRYWSFNLHAVKKLGVAKGGAIRRRNPLGVRGRSDQVAALAAELPGQRPERGTLPRGEDPPHQPPIRQSGRGAHVRSRTRRPPEREASGVKRGSVADTGLRPVRGD